MRNIKKLWLLLFCCTLILMTQRPVMSKAEGNAQEETGLDSLSPTDREIFQQIQKKYENFSSKSVTYNQNTKQKFNTNVVGEVVDAQSGEKIVNAIICIDDFSVQTDEEGRFQVRNMPNGYYTFTVSKDGYYESVYKNYPISEYDGTDIYKFFISKSQSIEDEYAPFHKDLSTSECVNIAVDELEETLFIEDDTNDYNASASLNSITLSDFSVKLKSNEILNSSNADEITRKAYVTGVVTGELYNAGYYSTEYGMTEEEVLELYKAQAVTARTYLENAARGRGNHQNDGYTVCSTVDCQVYNPVCCNALAETAVSATETDSTAKVITYNGDVIFALFFSSCNGSTKNNEDVNGYYFPYLRSVPCSYDLIGKNSGQCVGLCQWGSTGLARAGYGYIYILRHYYTGVSITDAYQ